MEIGQHPINDAEPESRCDKKSRPSIATRNFTIWFRNGFQGSDHGRSHGDDPFAHGFETINDFISFNIQTLICTLSDIKK